MAEYEEELGIAMVPFLEVVYVENQSRYLPVDRLSDEGQVLRLSGTGLRRRLALGLEIPEWFTFPEVAAELRRTYPPRHLQGFTVLFTGLSGAGKSTLATALVAMLRESGDRRVTLLDGDIVRKHLSSELGFCGEHRELNLRRIGFVAAEITRNGGIAVCAPIAPYADARRELRETIEAVGGGCRGARLDAAQDLRGTRPQGALCEGAGGSHQGIHGNRRSLRGARESRHRDRHRGHTAGPGRTPHLREARKPRILTMSVRTRK